MYKNTQFAILGNSVAQLLLFLVQAYGEVPRWGPGQICTTISNTNEILFLCKITYDSFYNSFCEDFPFLFLKINISNQMWTSNLFNFQS